MSLAAFFCYLLEAAKKERPCLRRGGAVKQHKPCPAKVSEPKGTLAKDIAIMTTNPLCPLKSLNQAPQHGANKPYVTPWGQEKQAIFAQGVPWKVWQAQAARQGHGALADLFSRLAGGENGRP